MFCSANELISHPKCVMPQKVNSRPANIARSSGGRANLGGLKQALAGYWFHRINDEHRTV